LPPPVDPPFDSRSPDVSSCKRSRSTTVYDAPIPPRLPNIGTDASSVASDSRAPPDGAVSQPTPALISTPLTETGYSAPMRLVSAKPGKSPASILEPKPVAGVQPYSRPRSRLRGPVSAVTPAASRSMTPTSPERGARPSIPPRMASSARTAPRSEGRALPYPGTTLRSAGATSSPPGAAPPETNSDRLPGNTAQP